MICLDWASGGSGSQAVRENQASGEPRLPRPRYPAGDALAAATAASPVAAPQVQRRAKASAANGAICFDFVAVRCHGLEDVHRTRFRNV